MEQAQQLQQLQNELTVRKSQLFDLQEQMAAMKQTADSYAKTLQEIVAIVGIDTSQESVQLADIVAAVRSAVDHEDEPSAE